MDSAVRWSWFGRPVCGFWGGSKGCNALPLLVCQISAAHTTSLTSLQTRPSTHTFDSNQLRMQVFLCCLSSDECSTRTMLATTELRNAQLGTIRTKLLKLGALIIVSARRVLISISSGCPYPNIFATAYSCLQTLPHPG